MQMRTFITNPENPEQFASALRSGELCVTFRELAFSGPEGKFRGFGTLYRKGDDFCLEVSTLEGESIPEIEEREIYGEEDWWGAAGQRTSGLQLKFGGISPTDLAHGHSHRNYDTGAVYERYTLEPEWISIERTDHVPDELNPKLGC